MKYLAPSFPVGAFAAVVDQTVVAGRVAVAEKSEEWDGVLACGEGWRWEAGQRTPTGTLLPC